MALFPQYPIYPVNPVNFSLFRVTSLGALINHYPKRLRRRGARAGDQYAKNAYCLPGQASHGILPGRHHLLKLSGQIPAWCSVPTMCQLGHTGSSLTLSVMRIYAEMRSMSYPRPKDSFCAIKVWVAPQLTNIPGYFKDVRLATFFPKKGNFL